MTPVPELEIRATTSNSSSLICECKSVLLLLLFVLHRWWIRCGVKNRTRSSYKRRHVGEFIDFVLFNSQFRISHIIYRNALSNDQSRLHRTVNCCRVSRWRKGGGGWVSVAVDTHQRKKFDLFSDGHSSGETIRREKDAEEDEAQLDSESHKQVTYRDDEFI